MAGAMSLGIPRNPDYNGAIQEGVSYAQRTIQNGRRVSAATAYLHPAMKRKNVNVRTHAHATSIIFEGKRAVGVRYRQGRQRRHADGSARCQGSDLVRRHVQLAATAAISGVGSPELLRSLGIEVRHALPGVGEGLQDHYAPRSVARVKNTGTINEKSRGLKLVGEALKCDVARGMLSLRPPWSIVLEVRRDGPKIPTCSSPSPGELQGRRAATLDDTPA